ncbi:copper resistance protein NlpE [Brumimicrobium sp.]|uniref:copper resistance protein NlpE n=1 Tax=Brumimicrobium sp. TaxID=2029867 RepID=UPI003A9324DB
MKKSIFILGITMLTLMGCKNQEQKEVIVEENMDTIVSDVVDGHNSQNALDWAGVYEGTLPCADCEGINTVIEIKEDNTFALAQTYLKAPKNNTEIKSNGTFSWDTTGSNITLKNGEETTHFKVGENQLFMLDSEGEMVEGELSEFYILKKKL